MIRVHVPARARSNPPGGAVPQRTHGLADGRDLARRDSLFARHGMRASLPPGC
jgi:hypothetical protein